MSANESRPPRRESGPQGHCGDQGQRNAPRPQSTPDRIELVASPASLAFAQAVTSRTAVVHCAFAHLRHIVEAARLAGADPAEQRQALDVAYHALVSIVDSALVEAVEAIGDGA